MRAVAVPSPGRTQGFDARRGREHGPGPAALVLSLQSVPPCVLIVLGGAVTDRWGIRRTIICCDAVMVLVLMPFLAYATRGATLLGLCLSAVVSWTAAALRRPADGVFPRLFADDAQLSRALASGSRRTRSRSPVARRSVMCCSGLGGLPLAAGADVVSYALVLGVLPRVRPLR